MIDRKRLLDTFLEYVRIDSETFDERAMSDRVFADLKASGAEVWRDDAGDAIGSNGYNVYARLAGVGEKAATPPMLFSAHLDTVKPGKGVKPAVTDGVVRSSGDTVLGGDDKAGVAAIVEALRCVAEQKTPHRTVEVLFTLAEESGLLGAKQADYGTLRSKRAVVLDGGGGVGTIITAAPGHITLKATITGKSAHAGIAPEQGVSAIQAGAAAVASMKLLRIDDETTANVGTFVSEYATNIVPERATIVAEARSRDSAKLAAQGEHMKRCLEEACAKFGAKLACEIETEYVAFTFADDHALVREVSDACGRVGVKPSTAATGGGSDANVMNLNGVEAVVLGIGMEKVHTTAEQIAVAALENTARMCCALMTGGEA